LLFKLAFHTYETLSNIQRLETRKEKDQGDDSFELDLISNMSDESTMTLGGPKSVRDKKIDRIGEKFDA